MDRPSRTAKMREEALKIDVDGLGVGYHRAGDGQPIVLLHGYVGDGLGTWSGELDALSDGYTVIAWDAPGFASSSDPPESFTLADYADCLAGFVKALDLDRPHVCGLSFGGGLALELYRRHPQVVRSLVLVSAYAGWTGSLPSEVVEFRLTQALRLADLPAEELIGAVVPTLFSPSAPGEFVERFVASMRDFHPAGLRATARSFARADLRDVLPTIDVPTLLIYGGDDVRAPRDVAESIHAAIPRSKLVMIEGTGHVTNVEAPDRFVSEVRAFLRSIDRPDGA
jgi:pimeloyl-ACP methyl ester carboxylesterase